MIKIDYSNLRFLVIEDNTHMRKIVRSMLHGFGSREVNEAEDGAAGLEAFQTYSPDIVIADWFMPILDGIELTRMIRDPSSSMNPYVPIIFLSAHSERNRVATARDAGVTEFLCKPISAKALYLRVLNVAINPRKFVKAKGYFGPDRRRFHNPNYSGEERRTGDSDAELMEPQPLVARPQ